MALNNNIKSLSLDTQKEKGNSNILDFCVAMVMNK